MIERKEGEVIPQGWSYTDCPKRVHVYFRDGDRIEHTTVNHQRAKPIKAGETVCGHMNNPFECVECRKSRCD